MRKKIILITLAIIAAVLINRSCKVIPLSEMKKGFDPKSYAQNVWLKLQGQLTDLTKINAYEVLDLFDINPEEAHQKYGKIVGISNYRYYIVEGAGHIVSIDDDGILVKIREYAEQPEFYITKRVFGNTIVMATGIIKMEDFDRIMDFNLVSTALNDIVSDEVAMPFIASLREKSTTSDLIVKFIGLFNLLRDDPVKYPITVIPLRLELSQGGY
ncbi:MAG: DUF2291 domain-containing protein [Pseudothermotoga sp.]